MDKKSFSKDGKGKKPFNPSFTKSDNNLFNNKKRPRDESSSSNGKSTFGKFGNKSASSTTTNLTSTTNNNTDNKYNWTKKLSNNGNTDSDTKRSKLSYDKSNGKRPGKAITKEDQEVSYGIKKYFSEFCIFFRVLLPCILVLSLFSNHTFCIACNLLLILFIAFKRK